MAPHSSSVTSSSSSSSSSSTPGSGIQKMGVSEGSPPPEPVGGAGVKKGGLSVAMTALMLIAQMAGAGFLSLPKALANSGWLGVAMMGVFCVGIGFSGTRLGACWVMLETRWPERYAQGSRQAYMDIAAQAMGKAGRVVALVSVFVTLFGSSIVYMILMSSFLNDLVADLSVCEWLLVVGAVVIPLTWLGAPKDFWQSSVIAAACTAFACVVIFVELIVEAPDYLDPVFKNPTVYTFALGFGAILFAFGGASVFPTIQNDMADRTLFGRSVVFAFAGLLVMYLPVALAGYAIIGFEVDGNILESVDTRKPIIKAAIVLEIINLIGTYIIACNPIFQICEEQLNMDPRFGWRRCVFRTCVVVVEVILGLAIPSFDKILNLLGGSTVTVCTFLLPGIAYLRLADMKGDWKTRFVPLWERVALILIVVVGVVGGVVSTVTAFMDILNPDSMGQSCFLDFHPIQPAD